MRFFIRAFALAATTLPLFAFAAPLAQEAPADESIPNRYIVQLKGDIDASAIEAHHQKVQEISVRYAANREGDEVHFGIDQKYEIGEFKAYAGTFDEQTIEELKSLSEVVAIEPDYVMRISGLVSQPNAPWGLARISTRNIGPTDYLYDNSAGRGSFTYVVDTGVRVTHREFGNRAIWGYNAVNQNFNDNNGHGTHVAGTVGGSTYGVAKGTTIVAVKVFEGSSGATSTVISGFQWAVNDIVARHRENHAVINMSLGGPGSAMWDQAITAAWNRGVLAVVAAGNENTLAANRSPARSPEALCVGNMQYGDTRYGGQYGSNYGPAVDIWAPGTNILSAYRTSDTAAAYLTGTSMASPHVAGLISYIRGLEGWYSAAAVRTKVLQLATPGKVADTQGAANLLAYNGNGR